MSDVENVSPESGEIQELSLGDASALLEKRLFGVDGDTPEVSEEGEEAPSEEAAQEGGDDTTEATSEPEPAIAPPASWSADEKAIWSKLPPEAQAAVQRRESERDKFVTTKANELAQERQQITQERNHYANNLTQLVQTLEAQAQDKYANVDWDRLSREDPASWVALRSEAERHYGQLQHAQQEKARIYNLQEQEQAQRSAASMAEERDKLVSSDPDFSTPEKAKATADAINGWLVKQGWTVQEIGSALNSAFAISTVKKAMLYDKLQASKPAVEKKASQPSKVVKPGASSGSDEGDNSRRVSALKGNLTKTGNVRDAARLLESMF